MLKIQNPMNERERDLVTEIAKELERLIPNDEGAVSSEPKGGQSVQSTPEGTEAAKVRTNFRGGSPKPLPEPPTPKGMTRAGKPKPLPEPPTPMGMRRAGKSKPLPNPPSMKPSESGQ